MYVDNTSLKVVQYSFVVTQCLFVCVCVCVCLILLIIFVASIEQNGISHLVLIIKRFNTVPVMLFSVVHPISPLLYWPSCVLQFKAIIYFSGEDAILAPSPPKIANKRDVPIEMAVHNEKSRPGSGQLFVKVLVDGPTRVLRITDITQQVSTATFLLRKHDTCQHFIFMSNVGPRH